jgi:hypothetical protein
VECVRLGLARLREDLRVADPAPEAAAVESALAALPAEVPMLPLSFRKNPEMVALRAKLLNPTSGPRIGFFGMGGAGKTVTSCWIARSEDVRQHFEHVLWVSVRALLAKRPQRFLW